MIVGIIYKYTSPNGKSYIGQTINEKLRKKLWNSSRYHYAGDKIDRARAKYGRENFDYTVLFEKGFLTKEIASIWLNIAEQYFIHLYDSVNSGYNCEFGGGGNPNHTGSINHHHGGYKLSDETKKKIGEASRLRQNTPEGKAKMSAARRGVIRRKGYRIEVHYTPVVQLSLDGLYIQEFPSMRDAEEYIYKEKGIVKNRSNIGAVCNGKRDSAEGYKWLFKEDYYNYFLHPEREDMPLRVQRAINAINAKIQPKKKKVYIKKIGPKIYSNAQKIGQYNANFQLVQIWRCAGDAAKEMDIIESNIHRAKKTLGMYMGYYWRNYDGQQVCEPKQKKTITRVYLTKKVVQKDLLGNVICTYNSIGQACESIGAPNRTLLSRCLNGKVSKAYGYKWEFLNCA